MLYLRAMERKNLILAARGEIEIAEVAV